MKIAFRTDASLQIGIGHVMRCLTLADELTSRGADCHFICREHKGHLIEQIQSKGHTVHGLPLVKSHDANNDVQSEPRLAHAAWLGADWATDAQQTLAILSNMQADWLIVDHYALDARWELQLRTACHRLMVIDDLADRPHDCDLLLDQNLGRNMADYADLVKPGCTVLVGPQYALLRPEFAALRDYSLARRITPQLKHLLITMGGVDQGNATGQVLDALRECTLPLDCRITVVMGPHAPWLEDVREKAATMPWSTEVLMNIQNMAKLMADSDLAIGAVGSTTWERCCLGLPSIMLVLADNQKIACSTLAHAGVGYIIREVDSLQDQIQQALQFLISDVSSLENFIFKAASITSGNGTKAIASQLVEPSI